MVGGGSAVDTLHRGLRCPPIMHLCYSSLHADGCEAQSALPCCPHAGGAAVRCIARGVTGQPRQVIGHVEAAVLILMQKTVTDSTRTAWVLTWPKGYLSSQAAAPPGAAVRTALTKFHYTFLIIIWHRICPGGLLLTGQGYRQSWFCGKIWILSPSLTQGEPTHPQRADLNCYKERQ